LWLSTREDRGLSEEEDVRNEVKQQQQIFTTLLLSHLENFKVNIFCSSGGFETFCQPDRPLIKYFDLDTTNIYRISLGNGMVVYRKLHVPFFINM